MLPIDHSWYEDYWYSNARPPKPHWFVRFAWCSAAWAALIALIVLLVGIHTDPPQMSHAGLPDKVSVWNVPRSIDR
jgi:hypothetical protein